MTFKSFLYGLLMGILLILIAQATIFKTGRYQLVGGMGKFAILDTQTGEAKAFNLGTGYGARFADFSYHQSELVRKITLPEGKK